MPAACVHDRIGQLDNRIIKFLRDPAATDVAEYSSALIAGSSTVKTQSEKARPTLVTIRDAKLLSQVTNGAWEVCTIMQFHVIDAEANIIQEARAEGMGPIDDFIVYRSVREASAQQDK